jgi:hypothetical protein
MAAFDGETGWAGVARHDAVLATLRAFAAGSGVAKVTVVLDEGTGADATLLECTPDGTVELTDAEQTYVIPPEAGGHVAPLPFTAVRPAPSNSLQADPVTGEIVAPVGAVANLAGAVMSLARGLGGRTVASIDVPTAEPGRLLTIAARDGEPIVVAIGDQQFELPA